LIKLEAMEGEDHSKTILYVVAVVVVIVVAILLTRSLNREVPEIDSSEVNTENIGDEISGQIEEGREAVEESIPESNPFGTEGTNPFDNYKNPFE